jgi:hypothetical protein
MKTVKLLLPDNLHHQLQGKATEAGFDLSTYMLALLAEGAAPRTSFPSITTPAPPPILPPVSLPPAPQPPRAAPAPYKQTPGHTKGHQSNLTVVLRWDILGKGERESIRASTAAASLVHIVARLHKVLGDEILTKLANFRVSRGLLISRNPEKDYGYGKKGKVYGNHRLPGTDYFVLTHSSTDQKIKDIKKLLEHLNLQSKLFEITKHRKS